MPVLDPERPYSPYQRRAVILKMVSKQNIDIGEAADKFKAMEVANPEGIIKLCDGFPKSPKDEEVS